MRFIWILLLLPIMLRAQESAWQSITISDGLSQGMVYDMLQDRQGFMWVATKDGLNRYDGYNFKVFTHDIFNEYSISGNTCTSLLQDSKGRLWIGTEKDGLNLFEPKTQRFYHAQVSKNDQSTGNYGIAYLEEDRDGIIWVITDQPNVHFKIEPPSNFPSESDMSDWVKLVPFSTLQRTTKHSIKQYNHALPFYLITNSYPFLNDSAQYNKKQRDFFVFEDKQNRVWIVLDKQLICWKDSILKVIAFVPGAFKKINHFQDGTIAICDQTFLWLMRPDELFKQDSLNAKNAYSKVPDAKRINTIFKDNGGNIWLGSRGYGLFKFNPRIKQFHSYLPNYSPAFLFQDQQRRIYFHGNAKPAYQYYFFDSSTNAIKPVSPLTPYPRFTHEFLLQDRQGNFWLVVKEVGKGTLMKFSVNWQLMGQYQIPYEEANLSTKLLEDKNGLLWLSLSNGLLLQFNPQTGKYKAVSYQNLLPQSGAVVETLALYQDQANSLWIGTQKGLVKAENLQATPKFSIYKSDETNRKGLTNDVISGMTNDPLQPDKYLWVSTKGGGLGRLNKETDEFEHFTEKQGLPNKVVYGILVGDDNNLWMSTNRGIARLNPQTLIFTNFNKSDGLQDDEFNTHSYFKTPAGELMFGGINGFNVFRASQIGRSTQIPELRLIGLKVNNQAIETGDESALLEQAIEYLPTLQLAHNQNQLSLEFGLMDFANPLKNRYRYQLEGIDKTWVEAGTNRFANYAQLPSGNYTFRVMGSTDGEVWSKPIELQVRVNPPFYRTWWAFLLYLSIISYVVYRFYQSQLNRVRLQEQLLYKDKEAERLAELDTLKTNFFANISHEFRTPLTLILGPMEQMVQEYAHDNRFPMIQRNAQRLLTLINQLLDISKLEAGEMQPEIARMELVRYFRVLTSSFSSLAESRQILFEVSQNQNEYWGYIDQDKVEKILANLLSNAFKFTEKGGKVSVQINYVIDIGQIEIVLSDTGIGIMPEKLDKIFNRFYQVESDQKRSYEGTGIGLALVKELVEVLKGSISVESKENKGTMFVVKFPVDEQTWKNYLTSNEQALDPTLLPSNRFSYENINSASVIQQKIIPTTDNLLLIIDDNADIRAYVRGVFEQDYQILEAVDGEEGIKIAVQYTPNIIISDLMMPKMDGFTFCRHIKSDEKTSHIPIVMLTAKANIESRIEGLSLGADDYLIKPFNTAEIKVRVNNLIKKQETLRQYFSGKNLLSSKATPHKLNALDEAFLQRAKAVAQRHFSDSTFSIEQFSEAMNLSQSQLLRKLKALTNLTIVEYMRQYRLQQAAELLEQGKSTVSDIAFQVGFESLPYFSKVFQEQFGVPPSAYSA